jgi:hypothetical protein
VTLPLSPPHTPRAWRRYDRQPPISEYKLHCMVADTLRIAKPDRTHWRWTHLPMGEKRDPATAGRLQRMGVKPGWPDFAFLHWTGHIYFLELKSSTGILGEDQQDFHRFSRAAGVECAVARSYDEAIKILAGWGVVSASIEFK